MYFFVRTNVATILLFNLLFIHNPTNISVILIMSSLSVASHHLFQGEFNLFSISLDKLRLEMSTFFTTKTNYERIFLVDKILLIVNDNVRLSCHGK